MRFRSSNFAMMSSPVRAIRAPSLNPAVSSGVLPAKLWLCPVDTPEVAPNMKAMRTHLLHRSTRIVTAYDLPFLFTFFRPYFRSAERKVKSSARYCDPSPHNHEAHVLHRLDIQAQEKDIRFSWTFRQSASRSPLSLRGKQKTRQIALYSCISTWPHSQGGVERRPLGRVCRRNRASRRMCHQFLREFNNSLDRADN